MGVVNMLHATRYIGGVLLAIGIAIFLYTSFVASGTVAYGMGIGTIMGAVFIFLIGMFLVATEEMLAHSKRN